MGMSVPLEAVSLFEKGQDARSGPGQTLHQRLVKHAGPVTACAFLGASV